MKLNTFILLTAHWKKMITTLINYAEHSVNMNINEWQFVYISTVLVFLFLVYSLPSAMYNIRLFLKRAFGKEQSTLNKRYNLLLRRHQENPIYFFFTVSFEVMKCETHLTLKELCTFCNFITPCWTTTIIKKKMNWECI